MENEEIVYQVTVEYLGTNLKNVSKKSDKFYEVSVLRRGALESFPYTVRIRYGKYGTKGQIKDDYRSWTLYGATQHVDSIIRKKRKKGYTDPVNALTRLATVLDG